FIDGNPTVDNLALVNSYLHVQKGNDLFDRFLPSWASQILPNLPELEIRPNHPVFFKCDAGYIVSLVMVAFSPAFDPDEQTGEGGCNNAAFSTIVTHEYGHYIAHQVIGSNHLDGAAFHEGYADSLSELVHNTGVIGQNWYLDRATVREPGSATITYPTCDNLAHTNGMLLGRLWWDIRLQLDDPPPDEPDNTRLLFVDWTMLSNGEAPPDTGSLCPTLSQPADLGTLIEVLTADDDDGDLSNGTPNSAVICQAFSDRGIDSPPGLGLCPLPLRGGAGCRADLNYDGVLDIFDFLEFTSMFAAGDMFCDFDGDGVLDFFDFFAFQSEFAAGC